MLQIRVITDANGGRVSIAIIIHASVILCMCDSVCLSVCPHDQTKTAETKIAKLGSWHRDSSSRYLSTKLILGQKVKGQGHRVSKCKKSRRDSHQLPSRRAVSPLND